MARSKEKTGMPYVRKVEKWISAIHSLQYTREGNYYCLLEYLRFVCFVANFFARLFLAQPDVLQMTSNEKRTTAPTDVRDAVEPCSIEPTLKRKPSVAKMTIDGMAYVVSVSA